MNTPALRPVAEVSESYFSFRRRAKDFCTTVRIFDRRWRSACRSFFSSLERTRAAGSGSRAVEDMVVLKAGIAYTPDRGFTTKGYARDTCQRNCYGIVLP